MSKKYVKPMIAIVPDYAEGVYAASGNKQGKLDVTYSGVWDKWNGGGKILARITGDVNSLKEVLTKAVTTLIPEAITVIGVLVIMLVKDWKLALASLCSLPILAVGIFTIQRINHKRWQVVRPT